MEHVHTITKADVGDGVYRHPFRSKMRSLLVSIKHEFGGIGPKDVGVKVYRATNGKLVWGRAIGKNNPRRRTRRNGSKKYRLPSAKSIARKMRLTAVKAALKRRTRRNCGCKRRK